MQESTVPSVQEVQGCEIHKLPDDFYCKDCDILCWSNWALLSENHKNHSFVSIDEIYKIKKESIDKWKDDLGVLRKKCQGMLDTSFQNVRSSKSNLKNCKTFFEKVAKQWIGEYEAKFNEQLGKQTGWKDQLECLIEESSRQKMKINELLEHPLKNKLIQNYNETVHSVRGVLVKQDNLTISEVIDGEDIENNFMPKYTSHIWAIPIINEQTPEDQYFYAPEFVVVKDKFKLGARVTQNKKSKSVNISLRISKPNNREKQYDVHLFHPKSGKLMDEFVLNVEKDKQAENHILRTELMNSK